MSYPQNAPFMSLPGAQLQYETVSEHSEYAHLLERTFSVTASQDGCAVPLLPSACVTLFFPSEGPALLCGPLTALRQFTLAPGQSLYGVSLRGGCGDWLWGENMFQLANCVTELEPHFPGSDRLCTALAHCSSIQEQNALFARLAALQGGRNYQPIPFLRRCLTLISQYNGQITVSELAEAMGCSPRYLNRLFRQKVGFCAKIQCELTQLHFSLQTVLTTPSRSLLHLAVSCGYFDQAHMNRHYRHFLGCGANHIRRHGAFPAGQEIQQSS